MKGPESATRGKVANEDNDDVTIRTSSSNQARASLFFLDLVFFLNCPSSPELPS